MASYPSQSGAYVGHGKVDIKLTPRLGGYRLYWTPNRLSDFEFDLQRLFEKAGIFGAYQVEATGKQLRGDERFQGIMLGPALPYRVEIYAQYGDYTTRDTWEIKFSDKDTAWAHSLLAKALGVAVQPPLPAPVPQSTKGIMFLSDLRLTAKEFSQGPVPVSTSPVPPTEQKRVPEPAKESVQLLPRPAPFSPAMLGVEAVKSAPKSLPVPNEPLVQETVLVVSTWKGVSQAVVPQKRRILDDAEGIAHILLFLRAHADEKMYVPVRILTDIVVEYYICERVQMAAPFHKTFVGQGFVTRVASGADNIYRIESKAVAFTQPYGKKFRSSPRVLEMFHRLEARIKGQPAVEIQLRVLEIERRALLKQLVEVQAQKKVFRQKRDDLNRLGVGIKQLYDILGEPS